MNSPPSSEALCRSLARYRRLPPRGAGCRHSGRRHRYSRRPGPTYLGEPPSHPRPPTGACAGEFRGPISGERGTRDHSSIGISDRYLESEPGVGDRSAKRGSGSDPGSGSADSSRTPISELRFFGPSGADLPPRQLLVLRSVRDGTRGQRAACREWEATSPLGVPNNFCKINEPVLRLWARILRELPRRARWICSMSGAGVRDSERWTRWLKRAYFRAAH